MGGRGSVVSTFFGVLIIAVLEAGPRAGRRQRADQAHHHRLRDRRCRGASTRCASGARADAIAGLTRSRRAAHRIGHASATCAARRRVGDHRLARASTARASSAPSGASASSRPSRALGYVPQRGGAQPQEQRHAHAGHADAEQLEPVLRRDHPRRRGPLLRRRLQPRAVQLRRRPAAPGRPPARAGRAAHRRADRAVAPGDDATLVDAAARTCAMPLVLVDREIDDRSPSTWSRPTMPPAASSPRAHLLGAGPRAHRLHRRPGRPAAQRAARCRLARGAGRSAARGRCDGRAACTATSPARAATRRCTPAARAPPPTRRLRLQRPDGHRRAARGARGGPARAARQLSIVGFDDIELAAYTSAAAHHRRAAQGAHRHAGGATCCSSACAASAHERAQGDAAARAARARVHRAACRSAALAAPDERCRTTALVEPNLSATAAPAHRRRRQPQHGPGLRVARAPDRRRDRARPSISRAARRQGRQPGRGLRAQGAHVACSAAWATMPHGDALRAGLAADGIDARGRQAVADAHRRGARSCVEDTARTASCVVAGRQRPARPRPARRCAQHAARRGRPGAAVRDADARGAGRARPRVRRPGCRCCSTPSPVQRRCPRPCGRRSTRWWSTRSRPAAVRAVGRRRARDAAAAGRGRCAPGARPRGGHAGRAGRRGRRWRTAAAIIPAKKVKAVDTTAAGDTFIGALAVALGEGESLDEAVALGIRAAATVRDAPRRAALHPVPRAVPQSPLPPDWIAL